ncbi:MAG: MFS transporter, partial [Pseudoxanthomonas sp.]
MTSNPSSRRNSMLALLLLIYTCNFVDRTILATLGQAIKLDLKISDTQLGLLQGLAFALFYTTLGIPLARLSERVNRVSLIAACLALWSAMTVLCGAAQSYAQLFLCRVGVGIGEAGCSPPAHSLITDMFPRERRATALAVYSFGIPLGTMVGAVSGGWLVDTFNWRVAMMVVGLPGVLLALVFRLMMREPVRGAAEDAPAQAMEVAPSIRATAAHLFGNRAFLHITIGATLVGFVGYGTGTFTQAYFIRMFHLTYAEVGLAFGLVGGLSAGLGTLLGGALSDWAGKRSQSWYALLPALGLLIAAPAYIYAFTRGQWSTALWCMLVPGLFHYAYIGPTLGVMHNLALPRMRAPSTALFFVVVNLIGLGVGPYAT